MTRDFLQRYLGRGRGKLATALRVMVKDLTTGARRREGMPMHDPLAVAAALQPELVSCRRLSVRVETEGRHTLGANIADLRAGSDRQGRGVEVEVALDVDSRSVLSFAPARSLPRRLARLVDIVVPNETEAQLLTGVAVRTVAEAKTAAARLHERGFRPARCRE